MLGAVMAPHEARDLETLRALAAEGARIKWLMFWGHDPRSETQPVGPWVLSQWHDAGFELDGCRYATAEHWMMAEKARLFDDQERCDKILRAGHPGQAKALGRMVKGFDEGRWQAACFEIVVQGNLHKFSQHPELGDYLLGTQQRVLVEASPRDRLWGIGLAADDPRAQDPAQWEGRNLLGFALMETRARLAAARG